MFFSISSNLLVDMYAMSFNFSLRFGNLTSKGFSSSINSIVELLLESCNLFLEGFLVTVWINSVAVVSVNTVSEVKVFDVVLFFSNLLLGLCEEELLSVAM